MVSDNNGRGVGVENMRSLVHLHNSSVSSNTHVAGLHVMSGVGDVNVTDSRIAFNVGDGVNITHSGGSRNVTRSLISSNSGFGVAVFVNDTEAYVPFLQETIVSHSVIYKNAEAGVLVGNFCTPALVNISANWFNDSSRSAVEIHTCWKQLDALNFVTLQVRRRKLEIYHCCCNNQIYCWTIMCAKSCPIVGGSVNMSNIWWKSNRKW